jgi:hypothetical protein
MPRALQPTARLVLAAFACALLACQPALGGSRPQHLPRVAPGTLLPSAGGVVLGQTTKAQLLARWGEATQCNPDPSSCTWVVGLGANLLPERGGVSDYMLVTFHPNTKRALTISLTTSKWQRSRLRGWKLPGGLGIGSPFPALRRAYPTIRWSSGVATMREGSVWLVLAHEIAGNRYRLKFMVDAGAARAASGHVFGVEILRLLPQVSCRLTVAPAPAPPGAAAGARVTGACSPAAEYAANWGRPVSVPISFATSGGALITSASSPFDPSCRPTSCAARAADWAVDVTLGLDQPGARLEATVNVRSIPGADADGPDKLRIGLG